MSDIVVDIDYNPHPAQQEIHNSRARFKVLCCGRRFGKTVFAANELFFNLYDRNPQQKPMRCWIVAPTSDLTGEVETEFIKLCEPLIAKQNKTKRIYYLYGPGPSANGKPRYHRVELRSGESKSLKGAGLDVLIIDEAADLAAVRWEQELRPTLLDTKGKVILISTPEGRNWFWDMFQRGQDRLKYPDHQSWSFPSHSNPHLDREELEDIVKDMPLLMYEQEILARFLDDANAFFRGVDKCIVSDVEPMAPIATMRFECGRCGEVWQDVIEEIPYVECPVCGSVYQVPKQKGARHRSGIDLAQEIDFNVVITSRKHPQRGAIRVVGFKRFNQLSWTIQKKKIKSELDKWHSAGLMDITGGRESILEDCQLDGYNLEGIKFTNQNKAEILHKLAVWIERQLIEIPGWMTVLINELKDFQMKKTKAGNWVFEAPAGKHDDCVIALALSVWLIVRPKDYKKLRSEAKKQEEKQAKRMRAKAMKDKRGRRRAA